MERFRTIMINIEEYTKMLSQEVDNLENDPTQDKLDSMKKEVRNLRAELTKFTSHLNNFRIW